jgi:hypothetical protein
MRPVRATFLAAAALGALVIAMSAEAKPPCGRGWRKHEYCGPRPAEVAPPAAVVVAPAPVYAVPAPPPPVVLAPPARPAIGVHVDIPLR